MIAAAVIYLFSFHSFNGTTYQYRAIADAPEDAYSEAAQACFNHYKSKEVILSGHGVDLIDVCANPVQSVKN